MRSQKPKSGVRFLLPYLGELFFFVHAAICMEQIATAKLREKVNAMDGLHE